MYQRHFYGSLSAKLQSGAILRPATAESDNHAPEDIELQVHNHFLSWLSISLYYFPSKLLLVLHYFEGIGDWSSYTPISREDLLL